jgi:hypothetical protein
MLQCSAIPKLCRRRLKFRDGSSEHIYEYIVFEGEFIAKAHKILYRSFYRKRYRRSVVMMPQLCALLLVILQQSLNKWLDSPNKHGSDKC